MSTSASIARVLEDGSVEVTNCNFDGYVSGGVGDELASNFSNVDDLDKLFVGQEIRSIENGDVEFYPEAWDETYANVDSWLDGFNTDFGYIFIGKSWHCASATPSKPSLTSLIAP